MPDVVKLCCQSTNLAGTSHRVITECLDFRECFFHLRTVLGGEPIEDAGRHLHDPKRVFKSSVGGSRINEFGEG